MTEPAYTEQDLREARKIIGHEEYCDGFVGKGPCGTCGRIAEGISRIRSEARAGMREACADVIANEIRLRASTEHGLDHMRPISELEIEIRSLPDLAADEAIERIKREARLESGLQFANFSQINRQRCEAPNGFHHKLNSWTASDWITATTGELGEMANIVKKLNRVRDGIPGNDKSPEELKQMFADELADVFIYLDLLAQSQGVSLEDAVVSKFNRTSEKVGYPERIAALSGKETEQ